MAQSRRPPLSATLRFVVSWLLSFGFGVWGLLLAIRWGPDQAWQRVMPAWSRVLLRWTGVQVMVQGAERLSTPAVIILNHVSYIDAVYPFSVLPPTTRLIIKKELERIPVLGAALRAMGAIFIDRKQGGQALAQIREAMQALPPGWSVMVFPEGTRSRSLEMLPFRRGAFFIAMQTGLPILPIGTAGQLDIVPGDGAVMRPGRLVCTVGEPIPSQGWTPETLDAAMAQCREALQGCIDRSRLAASSATPAEIEG